MNIKVMILHNFPLSLGVGKSCAPWKSVYTTSMRFIQDTRSSSLFINTYLCAWKLLSIIFMYKHPSYICFVFRCCAPLYWYCGCLLPTCFIYHVKGTLSQVLVLCILSHTNTMQFVTALHMPLRFDHIQLIIFCIYLRALWYSLHMFFLSISLSSISPWQ